MIKESSIRGNLVNILINLQSAKHLIRKSDYDRALVCVKDAICFVDRMDDNG